ncbi:MAG: hypothetical protein AB2541_02825 [Candidatus Thiodiazotropha sp.]
MSLLEQLQWEWVDEVKEKPTDMMWAGLIGTLCQDNYNLTDAVWDWDELQSWMEEAEYITYIEGFEDADQLQSRLGYDASIEQARDEITLLYGKLISEVMELKEKISGDA